MRALRRAIAVGVLLALAGPPGPVWGQTERVGSSKEGAGAQGKGSYSTQQFGGGLTVQQARSGLMVNDLTNQTAADLAARLMGHVPVTNVSFKGTKTSAGTFSGGADIIGVPDGIILSSGSIQNVVGPNQFDDISRSNGLPGDRDLEALMPGASTYDATVLEFDFVPDADTITFRYVFGSDEYNEFAGSSYNDMFGLFVNGTNVALVPGTSLPVSVNTVNATTNSQFFLNNDLSDGGGAIDIEMDGITTVLTATAQVLRGQVNHLKLAIADRRDDIYDSNVFITIGDGYRWVKGDGHIHTNLSGDVNPGNKNNSPLDLQIADARSHGFEWMVITDHSDVVASCVWAGPFGGAPYPKILECLKNGTGKMFWNDQMTPKRFGEQLVEKVRGLDAASPNLLILPGLELTVGRDAARAAGEQPWDTFGHFLAWDLPQFIDPWQTKKNNDDAQPWQSPEGFERRSAGDLLTEAYSHISFGATAHPAKLDLRGPGWVEDRLDHSEPWRPAGSRTRIRENGRYFEQYSGRIGYELFTAGNEILPEGRCFWDDLSAKPVPVRAVGLGSSDSHGGYHVGKLGSSYNYVRVPDHPGKPTRDELMRGVLEGRVVASRGGFIEFWVDHGGRRYTLGDVLDVPVGTQLTVHYRWFLDPDREADIVPVVVPAWYDHTRPCKPALDLSRDGRLTYTVTGPGFFRMALLDGAGGSVAYTNPLYIRTTQQVSGQRQPIGSESQRVAAGQSFTTPITIPVGTWSAEFSATWSSGATAAADTGGAALAAGDRSDGSRKMLAVTVQAGGSRLNVTLVRPDGATVTPQVASPYVSYLEGPDTASYLIQYPEPGQWQVVVTAPPDLPAPVQVQVQAGADVETPPSVSLDMGRSADPVSGTVTVVGSATDAEGVRLLILFVDGREVARVDGDALSYAWDTRSGADGVYTLELWAYDQRGTVGIASRRVRVDNGQPAVTGLAIAPAGEQAGITDGDVVLLSGTLKPPAVIEAVYLLEKDETGAVIRRTDMRDRMMWEYVDEDKYALQGGVLLPQLAAQARRIGLEVLVSSRAYLTNELDVDRTLPDWKPPLLTVAASPPVVGRSQTATITVTSDEALAGDPVVTVTPPGGTAETVAMVPQGDLAWTGTYAVPADAPPGTYRVEAVATDPAGNAGGGSAGFTVDTVPPTTAMSRSPDPNGSGWNNTDVTLSFSATDDPGGSGVREIRYSVDGGPETAVPGDSTSLVLSVEGTHQVTYYAVDQAGNAETPQTTEARLDKTAPATEAALSGLSGPGGCYRADVTVTLTAADALAGVAATVYNLDGAGWSTYTGPLTVAAEGTHTLLFRSMDRADNAEPARDVSFTIDKTPPEAVVRFDPVSGDVRVYDSETGAEVPFVVLAAEHGPDDEREPDEEPGWQMRQYTLSDCAGNTLALVLKHKAAGKEAQVKVISLQYNEGPVLRAERNQVQVEYSRDKAGALKEVEQKIDVRHRFEAEAKYRSKRDETEIKVKQEEEKKEKEHKETRTGMVILELLTDQGTLRLGY